MHYNDCPARTDFKACNCLHKYRVVSIREDGSRFVWGWSSDPGGGNLSMSARMHPETKSVVIEERKA